VLSSHAAFPRRQVLASPGASTTWSLPDTTTKPEIPALQELTCTPAVPCVSRKETSLCVPENIILGEGDVVAGTKRLVIVGIAFVTAARVLGGHSFVCCHRFCRNGNSAARQSWGFVAKTDNSGVNPRSSISRIAFTMYAMSSARNLLSFSFCGNAAVR
jgi:hypothetical protein